MVRSRVLLLLSLVAATQASITADFEGDTITFTSTSDGTLEIPLGDCDAPQGWEKKAGTNFATIEMVAATPVSFTGALRSVLGSVELSGSSLSVDAVPNCQNFCSAGSAYTATCNHHSARVALSASESRSMDALQFSWSTDTSWASFSSPTSETPALTFAPPAGQCINGTYNVHLTANDQSCSANVQLSDNAAPTFDGLVAENAVANCSDVPAAMQVTATDNCDSSTTVLFTEESQATSNPTTSLLIRTWSTKDSCNNENTKSQTITVVDTMVPEITGVNDHLTMECEAEPDPCYVTATDACSEATVVGPSEKETQLGADSCASHYLLVRTWTATDAAGNSVSEDQTVTVVDTTNPELIGMTADLEEITVECDAIPGVPTIYAKDNCKSTPALSFSESKIPGSCDDQYTIVRLWIADDGCGNTANVSQTVHVQDNAAPRMTAVEADKTVDSQIVIVPCEVETVDQCDSSASLLFSETKYLEGCDYNYSLVHSWAAVDDCGNEATQSQNITVNDENPPDFDFTVVDLTVECDQVPSFNVTATDHECGEVTDIAFSELVTVPDPSDPNTYTIERHWVATDCCDHETEMKQTITVRDVTNPTFVTRLTPSVTVNCDAVPPVPPINVADNCDCPGLDANVKFSESREDGSCDYQYTLFRSWSVTDCSGNPAEFNQTIHVVDASAPTFDPAQVAAAQSATHEPQDFPASIPTVAASDDCGQVSVTFSEETVDHGCDGNYTVTRTWTATNACGLTADHTQVITVRDTLAPTLSGSTPNGNHPCDNYPDAPTVTVTESAPGGASLYFSEERTGTNCNAVITRTWQAVDSCGHTADKTQVLGLFDNTPPEIFCATPETVECDAAVEFPPEPITATSNDTCDDSTTAAYSEEFSVIPDNINVCGDVVTYHFGVEDDCENDNDCSYTVTVKDTLAPQLVGVPEDITVTCKVPEAPTLNSVDQCWGSVDVTHSDTETSKACSHRFVVERTFTATDDCTRSNSSTQTITVQDDSPPTVDPATPVPADKTVECTLETGTELNYTDECTDVVETHVHDYYPSGVASGDYPNQPIVVSRNFTGTDDCGTPQEDSQIITISDTVDPYFIGMPAAGSFTCSASIDPPTASDACDENLGEVEVSVVRTNSMCPHNYTDVYTFSVADGAGNRIYDSVTVSAVDNTPPTFTFDPTDWTAAATGTYTDGDNVIPYFCEEPEPPNVTAVDDCSNSVTVTPSIFGPIWIIDSPLGNHRIFKRNWNVEDDCSNSADIATQTVHVGDKSSPTLDFSPELEQQFTASCFISNLPSYTVSSTDDCTEPTVEYTEERSDTCEHEYILIRSWSVSDGAHKDTIRSQTVTVTDGTPPQLADVPDDVTVMGVTGLDTALLQQPTATDNCANVQPVETVVDNDDTTTDCDYTVERAWYVSDECDNSDTDTQIITVRDQSPPVVTPPAAQTLECGATLPTDFNGTAVSCEEVQGVTQTHVGTSTDPCVVVYTYKFASSKNGGVEAVQFSTVTVSDTTGPVLDTGPGDITAECAPPSSTPPTFTDCTGVSTTLGFSERYTSSNVLERSWSSVDVCGNPGATHTQIITLYDTTPPTWQSTPSITAQTLECLPTNNPVWDPPTGTDTCSGASSTLSEETTPGNCPCNYTIVRTWSVVDGAGLSAGSTVSQSFTSQDTAPPTFVGTANNHTIYWNATFPAVESITGSDSSAKPVEITFTEVNFTVTSEHEFVTKRTWTVVDECGHSNILIRYINVIDTTPTWGGFKAEVRYNCSMTEAEFTAALDALQAEYQLDVQDGEVVSYTVNWTQDRIPTACVDEWSFNVTWKLTNPSGDFADDHQMFIFEDTEPPTLDTSGVADGEVEGCDVPDVPTVTASDNCDTDVQVDFSENVTPHGGGKAQLYVRLWVATDNCGRTSSIERQTVIVTDLTAPTQYGDLPDETVSNDCVLPARPDILSTDECNNGTVTVTNVTTSGCLNDYSVTYTWATEDGWNIPNTNTTVFSQTVYVTDNTDPIFVLPLPTDVTVPCDDVPDLTVTLTATDNCMTPSVAYSSSMPNEACLAEDYTLQHVWATEDNCGNNVNHTRTVVVHGVAPTISVTPQTLECKGTLSDNSPDTWGVTGTDDCSGIVSTSWTFSDALVSGAVGDCEYKVERTWQVEDVCGKLADAAVQTITYQDTTAPTLSGVPEDLTVNCDAPPAPSVTANDDCGGAATTTTTVTDAVQAGATAKLTIIHRTFRVEDQCGHSTEQTQIITVVDSTSPVLVGKPDDATVDCVEDAPTHPTASDNCEVVSIDFSEKKTPTTCDFTYVLERTWTATDDAGNTDSHTQTINVQDKGIELSSYTSPVPGDYECGDTPVQPTRTATGCASSYTVAVSEAVTDTKVTWTWSATDVCATKSDTQTVLIADTTPPVLNEPDPQFTVGCDSELPDASTIELNATDTCDGIITVTAEATTSANNCEGVVEYCWNATDQAGLWDYECQTVRVHDVTPPTLTFQTGSSDAYTLECGADDTPPVVFPNDTCKLSSNLDPDTAVVMAWEPVPLDGYQYAVKAHNRTWTAHDGCQSTTEEHQLVVTYDTTNPSVGELEDLTIECTAPVPSDVPWHNDTCGSTSITESITDVAACGATKVRTRHFTVQDGVGNSASSDQVVTVIDTTKPVLHGLPQTATLEQECGTTYTANAVTATDTCVSGLTVVSSVLETTVGVDQTVSQTVYSYFATDGCNDAFESFTLFVVDTTPPDWTGTKPEDATVACTAVPDPPQPVEFYGEDTCSEITFLFSETFTASCGEAGEMVRSWILEDSHGNNRTHEQTIIITDDTDPTFDVYPGTTAQECGATELEPTLVASDNCDDTQPNVAFSSATVFATAACEYTVTQSWSAEDACGNPVAHNRTIYVNDTTAPELTGVPADATFECDVTVPLAPTVSADDTCATNLTVQHTSSKGAQTCDDEYSIVRVWSATDDCSNVAYKTQTITIIDSQAPTITIADSSGEHTHLDNYTDQEYGHETTAQQDLARFFSASDTCDPDPLLTITETRNGVGDCPHEYTITRTVTAFDRCGNVDSTTYTVSVQDTTPPELSEYAAHETVECDVDVTKCEPVVVGPDSNCVDGTPGILYTSRQEGNVIFRTWSSTDLSTHANNITYTQTITLVDTTPPILSREPEDVTVECSCDELPPAPTIFAMDNCADNLNVTLDVSLIPGNTSVDAYQLLREWTATDSAGLSVYHNMTVTVVDESGPTFVHAPADVDLDCKATLPSTDLLAHDDCDPSPDVQLSEEIIESSSGCAAAKKYIRTWTATDRTGNPTTHTQTILTSDSTAPDVEGRGPICLHPNSATSTEGLVEITGVSALFVATDDCGSATVTLTSCNCTVENVCQIDVDGDKLSITPSPTSMLAAGADTVTLHAKVSDQCGNEVSVRQTFWVPATNDLAALVAPNTCLDKRDSTRTFTAQEAIDTQA